jgi:CRP-like cAMP-binding protein
MKKEGAGCDDFLAFGEAEVLFEPPSGAPQGIGMVKAGEFFGEMSLLSGDTRSATVIASEPCTVMIIPKEQFLSLMQSNPRIAHSLIESMARRIDLLNKEVTQLRLPAAE